LFNLSPTFYRLYFFYFIKILISFFFEFFAQDCACHKAGELCDIKCACNRNNSCRNYEKVTLQPESTFEPMETETFEGGPKDPAKKTALEIFRLFFNDTLYECIGVSHPLKGDKVFWEDIEQLTVALVAMKINPQPKYRNYWENSLFFGSQVVQSIISRDRFLQLRHSLSLCNHAKQLISALNELFHKNWNPASDLAIDEWLAACKEAYMHKQYIPSKPAKYGFKFFPINDKHGFCYSFFLYEGSQTESRTMKDTVLTLIDSIPDVREKSYRLFVDNLFGSNELAAELCERGVAFVMAIKPKSHSSRKIQLFNEIHLSKGEWASSVSELKFDKEVHSILLLRFSDKKNIFFLSNFCGSEPEKQKHRFIPFMVHMYNQCMNYVDKMDSVIGRNEHKSNWSQAIFSYLVRLVLNNSWRYWQVNNQLKCSLREFEMAVVCEYMNERKIGIKSPHNLEGGHGKKLCKHCNESSSTQICSECNVHLHTTCFSSYHEKKTREMINSSCSNIYDSTKKNRIYESKTFEIYFYLIFIFF